MLPSAFIWAAICIAPLLTGAQESTALPLARAIDQESRQLKDKSDSVRIAAIPGLANRIRQLPAQYALPLAGNLAVDHTDLTDPESLRSIAGLLAQVLSAAPEELKRDSTVYRSLAELSFFDHIPVSLDDPRYSAALRQLQREDQQRHQAGFNLRDLAGREWSLRSLRGKVVMLVFWADWCPPCRRELSDLQPLFARYRDQGFVVLTIPVMYEDLGKVKRFVTEQKVAFPVLLDPARKIQDLFHVKGVPATFLYDRSGVLVSQRFRSVQDFTEVLKLAGLQ